MRISEFSGINRLSVPIPKYNLTTLTSCFMQVFSNCGKPTLGPTRRRRRRRDVYNGDDYYDYQQGRVMNDGKKKDGEVDEDDNDEDEDDDEYDDVKPAVVRTEKKENVPEDGDRNKKQRKNKNNNNNNNGPKNGGNNHKNNRKKNNKNNGLEDEEEDQGGPAFAFHRLLKDIGTHVASTKNFWKRLPYEVCNNEVAVIETGQNSSCWNGYALARYTWSFFLLRRCLPSHRRVLRNI